MRSFNYIAVILGWLLCFAATACVCARFLRGADTVLYNLFVRSPQAGVVLLFQNEEPPTQRVLLPHRSLAYPTVYSILWENSTDSDVTGDSCFLRELSTILHCLTTQRGVQIIGISAAPVWADAADPTVRKMFRHSLKEIRHLRLGLQTTDSTHSLPIPKDILPLALPHTNIEGDISHLPIANTCTAFGALPGEEQNPFHPVPDYVRDELFSHEQAQERGLSLPLLVRWNDRVFPTLPLQLAMDALGLSQDDIRVRPGKGLQIGRRMLPLDTMGRTPLGSAHAEILPLSAALSTPKDVASATPAESVLPRCAIITRPSAATMAVEKRGPRLAATLSLLLARERISYSAEERPIEAKVLRVNPLQYTSVGLSALSLGCLAMLLLLPRLPGELPWLLRSTLLLAGITGILFLAVLWYRHGLWMSLCAWIFCWLELLVAQEMLRHLRASRT